MRKLIRAAKIAMDFLFVSRPLLSGHASLSRVPYRPSRQRSAIQRAPSRG
jgi:hypothetical protein